MKILTADTSCEMMRLHLSVTDDGDRSVASGSRLMDFGGQHSEHLIVQMQALLADFSLELRDLDLLVCTQGPGSFTGLRIAMSAMKGISLAGGIPLVAVPTMDALAATVSFFPGAVVPVIDARKKRYYSTVFVDGKRMCPDLDCDGTEVAELLEGNAMALVTGPDAARFAPQLSAYRGRLCVDTVRWRDIGPALAELGLAKFRTHGSDDIGTGPTYVRKSDAEIALQEKLKKEQA